MFLYSKEKRKKEFLLNSISSNLFFVVPTMFLFVSEALSSRYYVISLFLLASFRSTRCERTKDNTECKQTIRSAYFLSAKYRVQFIEET